MYVCNKAVFCIFHCIIIPVVYVILKILFMYYSGQCANGMVTANGNLYNNIKNYICMYHTLFISIIVNLHAIFIRYHTS